MKLSDIPDRNSGERNPVPVAVMVTLLVVSCLGWMYFTAEPQEDTIITFENMNNGMCETDKTINDAINTWCGTWNESTQSFDLECSYYMAKPYNGHWC